MAIKRLLGNTEIADSPFRSLQDVEKFLNTIRAKVGDEEQILRQLEARFTKHLQTASGFTFNVQRDSGPKKQSPHINTMKMDKVVVPSLTDLRENFKIADELQDQVDRLNILHSQVSVSFRGVRGVEATLKNIEAMKVNVETKLKRALAFLENLGKNYAPKPFKDMVEQICTSISEELTFSSSNVWGYCTETDNGSLMFTTYVQLMNLQDEDGDEVPEFFVVFTCLLDPDLADKTKAQASYYITVMHSFQTPGKFSKGRPFKNPKEAMAHLGVLLAVENIGNSIGTLPHNLDPGKLTKDRFRASDLVADIKVEPDAISFVFLQNANESQVKDAGNRLYVEVKNMLQSQMGKTAKLKAKLSRESGNRRYILRFTINHAAEHNQLDVHNVEFLKTQFGLDDKKLRQVINIING